VAGGRGWIGRYIPHGNLRRSPYDGFWRSRHERWNGSICQKEVARSRDFDDCRHG
jgi:hypothetical protein